METNECHSCCRPNNYLVWSILTTVFCCIPFGIVSIVYAAKVNNLWDAHAEAEAMEASRRARMWAIISAVVGLAGIAIYLIMVFGFGMATEFIGLLKGY